MSEFVDFETLPKLNKLKVTVNGKKTPLQIGDKIRLNDEDVIIRTVVAIQINEDGKILYTLERALDNGEFEQQVVSLTELKLLAQNASTRVHINGLCNK